MTLNELIGIAAGGYPDAQVLEYWDTKNERPMKNPKAGDTLAYFIAVEIAETFHKDASDEEQIQEAVRVLNQASRDICSVMGALDERVKKESATKPEIIVVVDGGLVQRVFANGPVGDVEVIDLDVSDFATQEELEEGDKKRERVTQIAASKEVWTEAW